MDNVISFTFLYSGTRRSDVCSCLTATGTPRGTQPQHIKITGRMLAPCVFYSYICIEKHFIGFILYKKQIMNITDIHVVYFSATYTTRTIVREIAKAIGGNIIEHDVTNALPEGEITLSGDNSMLIVGAPVYVGRIPEAAAEALKMVHGNNTPAVAVCVYGNRDYDDALLEIKDTLNGNGFRTFAAGAFIGRHCIFPKVAEGRPDASDLEKAAAFGKRCAQLLADAAGTDALGNPEVKGNRPYREAHKVPMCPTGDKKTCTKCMTCARLCPAGAISESDPCSTDTSKCIACGRCVVVCPHGSRAIYLPAYAEAAAKFTAAFSARREPETFF